jgi:hypothetical protein
LDAIPDVGLAVDHYPPEKFQAEETFWVAADKGPLDLEVAIGTFHLLIC